MSTYIVHEDRVNGIFKKFDVIRFKNGYAKDAPTMDVECNGIVISKGRTAWGAEPDTKYFVIKLGKILSISNYQKP